MLFDILELFKNNIRYIKIKKLLYIIILLIIKSLSFNIDKEYKVILFIYILE